MLLVLSTARCYVSVWSSYVMVKVLKVEKHEQAHRLDLHSYFAEKVGMGECVIFQAWRPISNILSRILCSS